MQTFTKIVHEKYYTEKGSAVAAFRVRYKKQPRLVVVENHEEDNYLINDEVDRVLVGAPRSYHSSEKIERHEFVALRRQATKPSSSKKERKRQ